MNLWSPAGEGWGRDSQGVWDGRGHTASRYEDAIIYVNYSDEACAVPEGVVEGHGYLMARKEGAEP